MRKPRFHLSVGFTGTQLGMNRKQKARVLVILTGAFDSGATTFRHGDCFGADFQAAGLAREVGFWIIGHPPINTSKRGYFPSDEEEKPAEYLARNHAIVDKSMKLIATPRETHEILRSGTWSTIRYARASFKHFEIVFP